METKNNIEYPFEYQELGAEETEDVKKYFTPIFEKLIRLGSKGYYFYKEYEEPVLAIYNMELKPSDTFVVSYPRSAVLFGFTKEFQLEGRLIYYGCGTTWTQELVWLLQHDCDFEAAKSLPLPLRFPYIESGVYLKMKFLEKMSQNLNLKKFIDHNILNDFKSLSTLPLPRLMKTHIPLSLLPATLLDTAKVVYVARDPRDVVVSYFFNMKSIRLLPENAEFQGYWNSFVRNMVLHCPYFEHVKEAWRQRNHPNMVFIFYEELSKDLPAVARRLATFFGKQYSEEQFQALCNHLKFDNFKNNNSVNMKEWQDAGIMTGNFIRKGQSGGWREHFNAEMTQQAERWIADNLRDTDLRFPQC